MTDLPDAPDRPHTSDRPGREPVVSGDVLGTPAPVMRTDRAASLVADVWGLRVDTVRPLSSERDANILLDGRYVLKVSNPAEDPAVVDMENAAMSYAARAAADLPVPSLIPAASGASVARVIDDAGAACLARLITVVPGSPAEGRPVTTELAGQIGALAARTSLALQGLFHRAGGRVLDWDVRRARHVLGEPDVLGRFGTLGPQSSPASCRAWPPPPTPLPPCPLVSTTPTSP